MDIRLKNVFQIYLGANIALIYSQKKELKPYLHNLAPENSGKKLRGLANY